MEKEYAEEFQVGEIKIKICDMYCKDTSDEDTECILRRIMERTATGIVINDEKKCLR